MKAYKFHRWVEIRGASCRVQLHIQLGDRFLRRADGMHRFSSLSLLDVPVRQKSCLRWGVEMLPTTSRGVALDSFID